jgi:EcsC protein family
MANIPPPPPKIPESANALVQALNWAYDTALEGFPTFDGARVIAANSSGKSTAKRADSVITWACGTAGVIGAATSIGGFITLPATLPANLACTALVQLRMVQAIAILAGHDPKDDRVRSMALLALLGMSAADVLKEIGISVARALTEQFIKDVVVQALAKAVVKGAITKTASRSITASVSRLVPLVGAVIGGVIDASATKLIGEMAIKVFMPTPAPASEKAP